jgi:hypothetical protein
MSSTSSYNLLPTKDIDYKALHLGQNIKETSKMSKGHCSQVGPRCILPILYTNTFAFAFTLTVHFCLLRCILLKIYTISALRNPQPTLQDFKLLSQINFNFASIPLANILLPLITFMFKFPSI